MKRAALLLFAALALTSATPACALLSDEAEDVPERPADVEGTWETAAPLMLAACASIFRDELRLTVALTPDGGCEDALLLTKTCRRYASMEMTINGRSFPAMSAGGWASAPSHGPDGTRSFACGFPRFEISSKDLFTETGTVDVGLTIGGERRDVSIEHWLMTRTMEVPAGGLVAGTVASVVVGPRYEGAMGDRDSARLVSDDLKIQATWIPVQWHDDRIELPLLDRLPGGEAELELEERRMAVIVGCPFSMCGASVNRSTRSKVLVRAAAE